MLRRVISALVLLALASTPVVARTRLFCRYTGVEITDCAEQGAGVVQVESCCDRQVMRALGVLLHGQDHQIAPPALQPVPAVPIDDSSGRASPAQRGSSCIRPTGPPVYVMTRALLI